MLAAQLGAALSVGLFDDIGTAGTAWLRLTLGAIILVILVRPRIRSWSWSRLRAPIVLGIVSGLMTLFFLAAIARLPLGTAIAIDFLGPLTVAVITSKSRAAILWPVLALAGVLILTEPWDPQLDPLGILFALLAGTMWGSYILLMQRVGDSYSGLDGLAIMMPVAAVTAAVIGVPQAWGHLTLPVVLTALVVALLMPVTVFILEMFALRRLTTSAFGTLMALEPAIAIGVGLVVLSQVPELAQMAGIALVVIAGIGAERIGRRTAPLIEPAG
ncbi:MAG: EamA family transporter [Candidatus Nanopelagicales bacterium]